MIRSLVSPNNRALLNAVELKKKIALRLLCDDIFINIVLQFYCLKTHKPYIAIVCLLFFISTKFAALHTLTHLEVELTESCEVCEYTNSLNNTLFTTPVYLACEQEIHHIHEAVQDLAYSYLYVQEQTSIALFCRPPTLA